jgi:hypothetical protein
MLEALRVQTGRPKKSKPNQENGAPGETRTPNLLIRSQTLYPIELRALGEARSSREGAEPGFEGVGNYSNRS